MGYCKGTKKDGQPCRNAVNRSQCSYCEYHVQAEKRKLGSGRAQLRGNFLKTSLRNAKTHYSGSQVAKASQHIPLKPCSKEQLLAVASNQLNQKTSMGARYVKRMAEEPCQSGYVDPDTPRGFGVFNPSNRVEKKASAAACPPKRKDGATAPAPSATARLSSVVRHVPRAPKDGGAILRRAGDMLRAEHSFITPAGHLPPEKVPGEADPAPTRRAGPPGAFAAVASKKAAGVGVAGGAVTDSANAPGIARPPSQSSDGEPAAGRTREAGSDTGGARPRGEDKAQRKGKSTSVQPEGGQPPASTPSGRAPTQREEKTGEEMVALDDELEVAPADACKPLVERDIDWGSAGSRNPQISLLPPNSAPGSKGKSTGAAKPRAAVPMQRPGVHMHRKVEYDEEVGGMVEVGHADAEWLNGRAPMPYQRPKPSTGAPAGWSCPPQQILQKVPNAALKEARAAQQSLADAEARIRAAEILKRRPLSGRKARTGSDDNPSAPATQHVSSRAAGGATQGQEGVSASREGSAGAAASPAQPVFGFYGQASAASAQRAGRRYGQAMQAAARRATNTVSDFTAAFGSVLEDASADFAGSRYSDLVEDEEHQRLDRVMNGLQAREEVAQKAESVTKLQVSAFHCKTCNSLLDRRKPECSGHDVQRVTTTKRWWVCKGCSYHFSTLGVRLPKTRCKRCARTDFDASAMGRSRKAGQKENLVTTVEQAFAQESIV